MTQRFPSSLMPAASLILLALLAGCGTSRERSVRPGINDPYFDDPSIEKWVARFESESREIFQHRRRIVAEVGLRPGMAVADVGAGTGVFTRSFAQEVGSEGRVYAVDILPAFIDHIRARSLEEGLTWVTPVLCREDSVMLPRESVDVVFLCDTYHHFEYPRSSLTSIHEALRPGGELVLIDFIRIPGQSRPWVLGHVRAGEDVVRAEVEAAGFEKIGEARFLEENYLLRFRRP
jgi:ubiquinone/menaquinone biosynthesis C-methylase UbiE